MWFFKKLLSKKLAKWACRFYSRQTHMYPWVYGLANQNRSKFAVEIELKDHFFFSTIALEGHFVKKSQIEVKLNFLLWMMCHMWLVEPPNPNKIEQCWECIFLKVYTQVITKIASKFFFTFVPLRKPRLSKMASIKTNKIKKRMPLLFINFW